MKTKKRKSFIQWLLAIFAMVFLGVVGAINGIGFVFAASGTLNTGISGLSASYSGDGTFSISSGTITGSVTTTSSTSCGSTTYTAKTGTLTFTNSGSNDAILSFSLSYSLNGGSATVNGDTSAPSSCSSLLAPSGTLVISITSSDSATNTTTITISSISLSQVKNVDVTFKAPTGGTYKVDGNTISSDTTITKLSSEAFAVTATPSSGYKFFGWFNETQNSYVSKTASDSLLCSNSCTIYPVFLTSTTTVWEVGSNTYTDLTEAISYATSSGQSKISLVSNGTLPAGSYTIPSGKTLLMPMDSAKTIVTSTPTVIYNSYATPTAFSILTMASGASITVANGGAICLPSQLSSKGQLAGWNGTPTGPDGRINMQSGSTITVQSGGNLYAWGYIYGSGSVVVQSGGTVYEAFQIKDWRGGTATSNINSYAFIFNQYYVQNIEVPLTIYSGATEKLYTSANASSAAYPMSATFIGSGGLFTISSGYMIKDYIESTDRCEISIYGNASISPMTISGLPIIGSISTGDYIMPITSNLTINVHSGTTTISQNVELLPSVEINIDSGATLLIASSKKMYVYDNDNWDNFTGSARLYVIGYSVANGTTAKRTSATLVDAKINVNGNLEVSGYLYTSTGGANITSSQGTGKALIKTANNSNATIYEMKNNSDKTSVTFNPAKLHNGQNKGSSYTGEEYLSTASTSSNITYNYCINCDYWYTGTHECPVTDCTVTFKSQDGNTTLDTQTIAIGDPVVYGGTTPTKAATPQYTYTFAGWATSANQTTGTPVSGLPAVTANVTYYAAFSQTVNTYTITWKNYDGSTLETDTGVPYGNTPEYNGATPTKPATAQSTYTFVGWATSANGTAITIPSVTGDATYFAVFSENANTYTITWKNYDGTETLETDTNVPYGSAPTYNGSTPTKPATVQNVYVFKGWATSTNQTSAISLPTVTGDATYYAAFEEQTRTYTITFKNDDGTTLATSEVAYGSTPTYSGDTPTKAATAQYSYTFNGWTPAITTVTGDATYTATYTSTINAYTVTWQNDDGTILETDTDVPYGTMPSYDGTTPTKAATAEFSYTFSGWTPTVSAVTGNVTYVATYTETTNTYTVIWKNGDTTLETDTDVTYGTHPSYDGATPTKAASGQDRYSFIGWSMNPDDTYGVDGSVFTVTGDVTYYAIFGEYHVGLYRDSDGYVRLYDMEGNFQSNVTGIFYYSSSVYTGVGDNNYYYLVDGVVQEGYGLVALQENSTTYLFYVLEDGTLLKETGGCTFYVSKTNGYTVNGITVQSGLYYFDANGHMYFGNSLLTGNTEFGVISSGTATIGGGH